jgi:hypothetical protein
VVAPSPHARPRHSAARSLGLVLAALGGLVAVRWAVTGAPSRPLAPPGSAAVVTSRAPVATPADLVALRGNLLYMGGRQPLLIDPVTASITSLPAPGAGRVRVLRQGGFIVLLARDGESAVQPANGASRPRPLGHADDVLPSWHPDRVWLVREQTLAPDQTYVLREIDLATRRQVRRLTLPYDAEPLAVVPAGVVVRDLHNDLVVRDPTGRRAPLRLGDFAVTFLDAHASLLAYLDGPRLHLRDLASGRDRVVAAPAGARSWYPLGPSLPGTGCCFQLGAFSPDASRLAVFTELAGPGALGLTMVDVASGRASLLAGSGGATPVACLPCLSWSRSGWLFFFNGGPGVADPAAWRPGFRAAIPLALDLRSVTTILPTSLAAA